MRQERLAGGVEDDDADEPEDGRGLPSRAAGQTTKKATKAPTMSAPMTGRRA